MPIEDSPSDLFDGFESAGAVCVYVHRLYGDQGLHDLFALPGRESRIDIEKIAAELKSMRLTKLAKLLAEIAKTKPETDNRCPIQKAAPTPEIGLKIASA